MLFVAFGGGINSTALLILLRRGDGCVRPCLPSVVLFADTGGEKPETYKHVRTVNEWALPWLGEPGIVTVKKTSKYSSLEDECLRRKSLPSLAYGWRSCSDKWKQEPQRKYLNHHEGAKHEWAVGRKVVRAIGFSAEESHRAKFSPEPKFENWFPLISANWDRDRCIAEIEREGLPVPVKSACFYCPASTKPDVRKLRAEHPELYERAIAMERQAELVTIKGLGRRWSWESLDGSEPHCIEQTCMCFDGE